MSRNHTKVVTRHIWSEYMEYAEEYRHVFQYKEIYKQRRETIERMFADAKERHGLRYTMLRGLEKAKIWQRVWITRCHICLQSEHFIIKMPLNRLIPAIAD